MRVHKANSAGLTFQITYLVSAGRKLHIVGDACVFGMEAYLMDESQTVSWYAVALTKNDEQWLGIKVGDESFQQVAESLNLLVALRVWKHHWQLERIKLEVCLDNVVAVHLVLRLKRKSPGMNQVARELALDLGDAAFRPDIVKHTAGVASEKADAFSRKHQPGVVCLLAYRAFQKLFLSRGPKIGGRQLQSAEACWTGRAEYINSGHLSFWHPLHCAFPLWCWSRQFWYGLSAASHQEQYVWHVSALSGLLGSVLLFFLFFCSVRPFISRRCAGLGSCLWLDRSSQQCSAVHDMASSGGQFEDLLVFSAVF